MDHLDAALKNRQLEIFYEPLLSVTEIETELYDLGLYLKDENIRITHANPGEVLGKNLLAGKLDDWAIENSLQVIGEFYNQGLEYRALLPVFACSLLDKRFSGHIDKALTEHYAVLGHVNKPNKKIWTAEDPVEITQPGLQQVQVHPKIGFTFANAMRAFLRADPDIILIGEMRDKETASIGVEASLTGHLVLSTLHTNSAPETISRLLDLGLDRVNFSDALLGILAQRLMRTLCADCKEPYQPEQKELDHLIDQYGRESFAELGIDAHSVELCRAKGCSSCPGLGYRGRVGIHEFLLGTPQLQGLIYRNAGMEAIYEQAISDGMRTLKQDGIAKIFGGLSDYSQLLNVTAE